MSSNKKVDASVAPQSDNSKCGYCKNNVVKSCVKCGVCSKSFHPSCGVKFGKCCGETMIVQSVTDTKECENFEKSSGINNDSTMKDLMIKIIEELEARNLLLMENTSLLKTKISDMENKLNEKDVQITTLNKKLKIHTQVPITDKDVLISTATIPDVNASTNDRESVKKQLNSTQMQKRSALTVGSGNSKQQQKNKVTSKNVNKAIQEAKDIQLMNKYIEMEKDVPREKSEEDKLEWKIQSRKRSRSQRTLVVGNYGGPSSVEGIEKYKAFHVSNLKPSTTVEELQTFLGKNFTGVRCELVKSRYPESYASFKVLIKESEFEKVLVSTNWPNRSSVHRFFQPRASFLKPT